MTGTRLTKLFREFFESERTGGLLLIFFTVASVIISNTSLSPGYLHFWHLNADLSFGSVHLDHSIGHWVNDGLMSIFFLLVGLEIERELYIGELTDFKRALLPIVAAIGGMLVPAAIHFLFNQGSPTQAGIGIPMATDIAFALGILSLLGNKVPASVKIFLTALAIIDDLGAVLIIAIFYTRGFSLLYFIAAMAVFAGLLLLNRLKVTRLVFYIVPGIFMWYFMMQSGIHATVSGVLLAFAVPFPKKAADHDNPSYRLQHLLHKPVAFLILPIFAMANTGIELGSGWYNSLLTKNSLGILLGLVAGKPLGVLLFCALSVRAGWCSLPGDMKWGQLLGAGLLAGIGFTMSIFITNLAFEDADLVGFSKISILAASILASLFGFFFLAAQKNKTTSL
ncbi:MAG: Na+/H+ antiporter NhaA [Puia sp.]|nr:Na+/H+ antiporter NhaA [Puia sp.]